MRTTILLPFCLLLAFSVSAQKIDVTAYSFFGLGINTSKDKKFGAELKGFFNRPIKQTSFDLAGMYQFPKKTYHQFSMGAGVNLSPFRGFDEINSFILPVQLAIFPVQSLPQFSLVAELSPEIYIEGGFAFRQIWGVRYAFGKR